jgi:hypothetical protein
LAQLCDEIFRHREPLAGPWAVDHVVKPTVFDGGILAFIGHGRTSAGRRPGLGGPIGGHFIWNVAMPGGEWAWSGGTHPDAHDHRREGQVLITEGRSRSATSGPVRSGPGLHGWEGRLSGMIVQPGQNLRTAAGASVAALVGGACQEGGCDGCRRWAGMVGKGEV